VIQKKYLAESRVFFQESWDDAQELRKIISQVDLLYITQIPKDPFILLISFSLDKDAEGK